MPDDEQPRPVPPKKSEADGEGMPSRSSAESDASPARIDEPGEGRRKVRPVKGQKASRAAAGESESGEGGVPGEDAGEKARKGGKLGKAGRGVEAEAAPGKAGKGVKAEKAGKGVEAEAAPGKAGKGLKPGKAGRGVKPGKAGVGGEPGTAARFQPGTAAQRGGQTQSGPSNQQIGAVTRPVGRPLPPGLPVQQRLLGVGLGRVTFAIAGVTLIGMVVVSLLDLEARSDFFLASAIAIPLMLIASCVNLLALDVRTIRGAATQLSLAVMFVLAAVGGGGALYALADSSNAVSVGLAAGALAGLALLLVATLWVRGRGQPS
jgi:hypothetical protein